MIGRAAALAAAIFWAGTAQAMTVVQTNEVGGPLNDITFDPFDTSKGNLNSIQLDVVLGVGDIHRIAWFDPPGTVHETFDGGYTFALSANGLTYSLEGPIIGERDYYGTVETGFYESTIHQAGLPSSIFTGPDDIYINVDLYGQSTYTAVTPGAWYATRSTPHIGNKNVTATLTYDYTPGPVPEPATWAMMIAGFGLVGGAMRRRRAARPVAAS